MVSKGNALESIIGLCRPNDETGIIGCPARIIDLRDPLADHLRHAGKMTGREPAGRVGAMLGIREIFAEDPPRSPLFRTGVTDAMTSLMARSARQTIDTYSQRESVHEH